MIAPDGSCRVILYEYPFNERIRTYLRLEQLFQRLAAIALGRPAASEGLPADPHFFAAALLLRELMHHLGVERVVTSATTPSAPA